MSRINDSSTELELLRPYKAGRLELRNRLVMAPMVTNYGTEEGYVSEQMIAYYEKRARAGVGLIIIEATSVDFSRSKCWVRQLSIDNDKFIPDMTDLVEIIHKHGAKAILQIHHGGSYARTDLTPLAPLSPSAVHYRDAYFKYSAHKNLPEELTTAGISDVLSKFVDAAKRAQQAGFDGLEINAAHGYLFGQFISAARNRRTDAYGGEIKNRARFLLETIHAIREVVGPTYPIWSRISAEETGMEGGITFEETKELVSIVHDSTLDAIDISGVPPIRTNYAPPGYFVKFSEEIRKLSRLPVIIAGAIDIQIGEKVLNENKADLIAMGRAFLADPEFPKKLAEGRADEIRPCLRCCLCRDCIAFEDTPVKCAVNPVTGREKEFVFRPAENKKRIVVVGSGPAGMEAALVATEKGHDVTIYEKDSILGGQLVLAAMLPNKEPIEKFKDFLISRIKSLGVKVVSKRKADVSLFSKMDQDAVLIATGSTPVSLEIPCSSNDKIVSVKDILTGEAVVGGSVIIIGSGMTGCEIAHYLVKKGKKVTIVEMASEKDFKPSTLRAALLGILEELNVTIMTETKAEKVTQSGLIITDKDGKRQTIETDTVVSVIGRRPDTELFQALKEKISNIHPIGDAIQPGRAHEAIHSAFYTALRI